MFDDRLIISLEAEDGSEIKAAVLDDFDFEGKHYLVLGFEGYSEAQAYELDPSGAMAPCYNEAVYAEYNNRNNK